MYLFSKRRPVLNAVKHNIITVVMATEWPFLLFSQWDPHVAGLPYYPPYLCIDPALTYSHHLK